MVMPGITGTELLETVEKEKLGGGMVRIVLSNQGQESDIEAAKKLGADGYIVKANSVPSEVLDKVINIIENKSEK
jgi:DNA-binding NarL/FixJ family response regulator